MRIKQVFKLKKVTHTCKFTSLYRYQIFLLKLIGQVIVWKKKTCFKNNVYFVVIKRKGRISFILMKEIRPFRLKTTIYFHVYLFPYHSTSFIREILFLKHIFKGLSVICLHRLFCTSQNIIFV